VPAFAIFSTREKAEAYIARMNLSALPVPPGAAPRRLTRTEARHLAERSAVLGFVIIRNPPSLARWN
jgi:hypothetical protein